MDLATFNRYRRTGVTNTTRALEALFRDRPDDVVNALDGASFEGLPDPFSDELSRRGLSDEELKHISEWPDGQKQQVRVAVRDAIRNGETVRFAWKLHDASEAATIVDRVGPDAIKITFFSPWDNLRAMGQDEVCVDA